MMYLKYVVPLSLTVFSPFSTNVNSMLFTSLACNCPQVLHKGCVANYHKFERQLWDTRIQNNQKERICYTMCKQGVNSFPWDALEAKILHRLNTTLA